MVANLQTKVFIHTADARAFVRRLSAALRLKGQWFNVCFVDDSEIRRLNGEFRGKPKPTDVLSFPWRDGGLPKFGAGSQRKGEEGQWGDQFAGFLGDIVISAETAQRNAAEAGHSLLNEGRWLILHGALHLLGYDHSTDDGEMTALELSLRGRLGIDGLKGKQGLKGKSKSKEQKAKIMKRKESAGAN
jgi:probable rRNA maturation factor